MAESVYRVTELVGTSAESWEKAAQVAIETASSSLRDLRVAEVVKLDMTVENGKVARFRTRLNVSFKYESEWRDADGGDRDRAASALLLPPPSATGRARSKLTRSHERRRGKPARHVDAAVGDHAVRLRSIAGLIVASKNVSSTSSTAAIAVRARAMPRRVGSTLRARLSRGSTRRSISPFASSLRTTWEVICGSVPAYAGDGVLVWSVSTFGEPPGGREDHELHVRDVQRRQRGGDRTLPAQRHMPEEEARAVRCLRFQPVRDGNPPRISRYYARIL